MDKDLFSKSGPLGCGLDQESITDSVDEHHKVNFSDLKNLKKLTSTCTYVVKWKSENCSQVDDGFFNHLWTTECSMEKFTTWWNSLWSSHDCMILKSPPPWASCLVQHMYGIWYCGEVPFKNGAGKLTCVHLLSIAMHLPPDYLWTVRTSSTIHPVTDWCGLHTVKSQQILERNLNGKYFYSLKMLKISKTPVS